MKIPKQRLRQIIKEELINMKDLMAPGLGEDVRFTAAEGRDDAMTGANRPGAGIEDIAAVEDEETRDRAFDSPEGRLITLIKARDVLNKMTRDELEDLSMSLDAPMVATLQHILANPMYAPVEESNDVVEGQYETGAQRAARERAREAKIRELMRTQGLSRSAAEKFAGRSYSQTR